MYYMYCIFNILCVSFGGGQNQIQGNILTVVAFDVAEYADVHKFRDLARLAMTEWSLNDFSMTSVPVQKLGVSCNLTVFFADSLNSAD